MNINVNYELAKLLKEKGFNEDCNQKYIAQCLWQKPNSREKYKNSEIHKNNSDVTAPTIAEVVMWLYEKHGIWIDVRYMDDVLCFGFCVTTLKDNTEQKEVYNYSSPIKAYEAAIEYVLSNLI